MTSRRVATRIVAVLCLVLVGWGGVFRPEEVQGRQPAAPVLSERQRVEGPVLSERQRVEGLPAPEKFFGFQMGADRKLANWDKLHEYYQVLAKGSNKLKLVE